VACRYLSPACLASSSHLVPAARAALAVTDTCMVRRRVQYGTGSVCGNRARNVGIVRKSCRGEQRARPTLAPRLAQAQHASLAVPTGLASAAPRADAQRRGRRMTGARANHCSWGGLEASQTWTAVVRATPRARCGHALIWRWCGSGRVSPRLARCSCGRWRRPRPPGWRRSPRPSPPPRAAGGPSIRR